MDNKIAEACLKLRANLRGAIEQAHLNLDVANSEADMLCLLVVKVTEQRDALVKACEAALPVLHTLPQMREALEAATLINNALAKKEE